MRILIDDNPAKYQIISVTPEYVQVNDQKLASPFILSSTQLIPWESATQFENLQAQDFDLIFKLSPLPEIVILGTGLTLKMPSDDLLREFYSRGIGIECMDTRSACHTYSILSSEARNIVACFFIK